MKRKDTAVSVHDRLLKLSKESGRPFQELLFYYGIERFLFRLSRSRHVDKLVLKGALMLHIWSPDIARATRDIDFLGKTDNDPDEILEIIREVCVIEEEEDGVLFDPRGIRTQIIKEEADYQGIRVTFMGRLGKSEIPMQLDIGFGDAVHPHPQQIEYPTLLKTTAPTLKGYPREALIAEKFQAMVHLGELNSRMKDFYDVWFLARGFDFEGSVLAQAIQKTFKTRNTDITLAHPIFAPGFAKDSDKQTLWAAFVRRSRLTSAPAKFSEVLAVISDFLGPLTEAAAADRIFAKKWNAPGPWS